MKTIEMSDKAVANLLTSLPGPVAGSYGAFRRADAVWITTGMDGTVYLRRGTFADSPEACDPLGGKSTVEKIGYLGATAEGVEFDETAWTITASEFAAFVKDPDFVAFDETL